MYQAPILLIALAVGYWVLTISQNQKRPLDILGRIVGAIILLVALGGLICGALCGGSCGSPLCGSQKMGCPMANRPAPPADVAK